jgi:hypothetical protein
MSEQNITSTRPEIEKKLKDTLSGDLLENVLDFVAFLREIGMTPDENSRFHYMGEMTCILVFFKDTNNPQGMLFVCDCPIREHDGFPIDDSVKKFAQSNIKKCDNCGCEHEARGATKTVFGKEYDNLCSSEVIFVNPDAEALVKVKILMELWKHIISDTIKK